MSGSTFARDAFPLICPRFKEDWGRTAFQRISRNPRQRLIFKSPRGIGPSSAYGRKNRVCPSTLEVSARLWSEAAKRENKGLPSHGQAGARDAKASSVAMPLPRPVPAAQLSKSSHLNNLTHNGRRRRSCSAGRPARRQTSSLKSITVAQGWTSARFTAATANQVIRAVGNTILIPWTSQAHSLRNPSSPCWW